MSMLETAIKRVGELTAMVEFLKLRVDHYKNRAEHYRSRFVEVIRKNNELRRRLAKLEVPQVMIQVDALRALFGHPPASELYAAQSELELLRVIRKSQGEGITKLRKEKDELLKRIEHDATVIKRIGDEKVYLEQAVEMLQCDLRDAREATNAGAIRYCDVCKERDELYREMDRIRKALDVSRAINRIIDRRRARTDGPPVVVKPNCGCEFGVTVCPECDEKYVVYSNPVEAMKANPRLLLMLDEERRAYNRNVDNQKSYEAPNCPSS